MGVWSTALSLRHLRLNPPFALRPEGIYAPETFERQSKYGLGLMVTKDDKLQEYLKQVGSRGRWATSAAVTTHHPPPTTHQVRGGVAVDTD